MGLAGFNRIRHHIVTQKIAEAQVQSFESLRAEFEAAYQEDMAAYEADDAQVDAPDTPAEAPEEAQPSKRSRKKA